MSDIEGAAADPKKTASYKAALAAVIILTILFVLALIGVVVGIVLKTKNQGVASPAVAFALPADARILSTETQPGRLILHVRTTDGEEIDIIDTANGKLITRIKAAKAE